MQRDSGLQGWLKVPLCTTCFKTPLEETRCVEGLFNSMFEPKLVIRSSILDVVRHRYYHGFQRSIISASTSIRLVSLRPNGCTLTRELSWSATLKSVWDDSRFRDADIVIGLGILHHLEDNEAEHCIRFAHRALKQGGRFVCFEACWVSNQGFLSRYIMSKDRGQNIRTEQTYRQLAANVFKNVNAWVETKPLVSHT